MVELRSFNLLILLLLLSSGDKMEQIEAADTCEALSKVFFGLCFFDHHCEMACIIEGYTTGRCSALHHHCFCLTSCNQPSPPPPPPPAAPPATPPAAPPAPPPESPPAPKVPCQPHQYPPYKDPPATADTPESPPYPPFKTPRILKSWHHPRSPAILQAHLNTRRTFDDSKWCTRNK